MWRYIVCAVLMFPSTVFAANWEVRDDESRLGFIGIQSGSEFEGAFQTFEAAIQFDPDDLEHATVSIEIFIDSFHWIDESRRTIALSPEWFAALAFPRAHFEAETFFALGDSAYEAAGILTIKGVSHPFVLPFELVIEGDVAHMRANANLLRHDFGVGSGDVDSWFSNEVRLDITLVADRR